LQELEDTFLSFIPWSLLQFPYIALNCIFDQGLEDEIFSTQKKKEVSGLLNLSIFPWSLLQFVEISYKLLL
jgi:hypothetical protein